MIKPLASPGDIVDLHRSDGTREMNQLTVLVKTQDVEIIQLFVPAGSNIPTYEAEGEIILHCLEGRISLTVFDEPTEMKSGQLLYLSLNEPFSIQGLEHASVIIVVVAPKQGLNVELIGGQNPK